MLTFPNVTPAVFALVLDQLRKEGSDVQAVGNARYSPYATAEFPAQFAITGHHWPLGDIRANVAFDGATVTVDVLPPNRAWEPQIGGKIGEAISAAQRKVAST